MLVINNGAPKGGSTWLQQIIRSFEIYERVPAEYQDNTWWNSSIDENKLDAFLLHVKYQQDNYFCKQHWVGKTKYKKLLEDKHVKIVNIIRDIRDVLVSRFFHEKRLNNLSANLTIEDYYWNGTGKAVIKNYIEYQRFWHDSNLPESQPFLCSYKRLHNDFVNQVLELANYLNLSVIQAKEIEYIREKTNFKNKKETGEGKFFRKGSTGDWQNHLSDSIINDIKAICNTTDYFELQKKMSENFNLSLPEEEDLF
ncbi:MAG: sulfotransferase domain-containing protein [Bacteroidales bacterium]|nr:sulfotransferase domain-containing protein [Bacteroidales bacterium]